MKFKKKLIKNHFVQQLLAFMGAMYIKIVKMTSQVTVKNIDALSRNGEIYSIKTVSSRNGTTGSFWDPESIEKNEKKFDYLLIVIIDQSYALDMILELSWEDFFKYKRFNKRMNNYNISLTNTLINEVNVVYERR